jgi:sortase A
MSAYQPATDLWAAHRQDELSRQLITGAQPFADHAVARGKALTRLEVPRLGIDVVVVEGTTAEALRNGAGHYEDTAYPGERGNASIAGHRTTYGAPFNRIDELVPGDRIILTTPLERHTYRVIVRPWTVEPTDWSPIRHYPEKTPLLTLTSCTPEGSDARRIVVRALLFDSQPLLFDPRPIATFNHDGRYW